VIKAPVEALPVTAWAPLQPPEAVQDVVLAELQVRVAVPPVTTLEGLAVKVIVGSGAV